MADEQNVTIRLEAVDDASPTLRQVRKEALALQGVLSKSFDASRFRSMAVTSEATVSEARRALDPLARMQEQAARAERAQVAQTVSARAAAERTTRADAAATARLRSNLLKAQDRAVADSLRAYRTTSRIKANTLRSEQRETDRAAKADRDRAADQARSDRQTFALRQRWRRAGAVDKRRADREAEKAETAAARRRAVLGSAGRDLAGHTVTAASRAGLIVGAGAMISARKIMGVETDTDAAEIDMRAASGMSATAARELRSGWAATSAEALGASSAEMLRSYTEALKVGIPDAGAKTFTEVSRQASEAWQLPADTVTDALGTLNALQTASGQPFDPAKFKGVANSITALADKMATNPERMLSFMARGAGASQVLGMSQDLGLALGAASTSLGNEGGQSGRMFDFLAGRTIDMPRLTRKRGEEGQRARDMVKALGFSSGADLDRRRRANPDDFVFDLIDRFARIRDTKKRDTAMQFFTGREWFGEFGRLVTGKSTVKEAKTIALEARKADALGARWELHKQKLSFLAKQITAGVSNIVGEFGMAASPIARDLGAGVLRWSQELRAGGIGAAFSRGLDGLVEGLVGRPIKDALASMHVGKIDGEAFFSIAKGFGAGLRSVGNAVIVTASAIGSVAGFFGSTGAKLAAELMGFSAVVLVLKPVLGVVGSFAKVLASVVEIAAPGRLGLALTGLSRFAGIFGLIVTAGEGFAKLTDFAAGKLLSPEGKTSYDALTNPKTLWGMMTMLPGLLGRMLSSQSKVDSTGRIEKQSFYGEDDRTGLLHRTAFIRPLEDMRDDFRHLAGRLQLATFTAASSDMMSAIGGTRLAAAEVATPSSISGGSVNTFGLGRRGIIGGAAGGNNYGAPSSSLLDFIAKSEGADYNVSWGNGRFMPGGREQNLTGKSLNEILSLGQYMRAQPGSRNSSAMGRYQITGSTIRDLMGRMHLSGNELFDQKMQDAMASKLIQDEGPRALLRWEGLKIGGRMGQAQALLRSGKIASIPDAIGGLPLKSTEATAGGASSAGIVDMAKSLVALNVPGGMGQFTALNDAYHHRVNLRSKHTQGLAADFTIKDASKSSEAAERVRQLFRAAGLAENAFKVIDEYRNPSGHATGGHIHYQLNSQEAAQTYAAYAAAHKNGSDPSKVAADLSSGGDRASRVRASDAPSHNGQSNTYITQHIQGGTNDPEALANKVQRRVNQESRWRVHDVENI